jgi:hypothetical protein
MANFWTANQHTTRQVDTYLSFFCSLDISKKSSYLYILIVMNTCQTYYNPFSKYLNTY